MEPPPKDRSWNFDVFLAHALDIYFPLDRDYGRDFVAEPSVSTAGDDGFSDIDRRNKSKGSD